MKYENTGRNGPVNKNCNNDISYVKVTKFDLFDFQDPSDSSDDDDKGATTMQVSLESDHKIEINPYWSKIKIDELQGLGTPVETLSFDTDSDSMPDLVAMSGLDNSCKGNCSGASRESKV